MLAVSAGAQPEETTPPPGSAAESRDAADSADDTLTRAETLERLTAPVDVAFDGQPLHDVVRYLSLLADVTLEPLWINHAEEIGLDPMSPIDLDARGLSALECLELVLAQVSEDQKLEHGATWQFSLDDLIEFGPRERLNRPAALRAEVYDVHDLLATLPPAPPAPRLSVSQATQPMRGGGGSGGWVFPGDVPPASSPPEPGPNQPIKPSERLIVLITTLVEPDQWVRNGGEAGIIEYYDGALVVLAPDYIHRGLVGPLGGTEFAESIRTNIE